MDIKNFKKRAISILKAGANKVVEIESENHELVLKCSNGSNPVSVDHKNFLTLYKVARSSDIDFSMLTGNNSTLYFYFW